MRRGDKRDGKGVNRARARDTTRVLVQQAVDISPAHKPNHSTKYCTISNPPTYPPTPFKQTRRLLGVGSCSGCLYAYIVRSGAEDVSSLYPHARTAMALRPLPLARAVLAAAGALVAALAAIAYALGVPVQDVASAVLMGEGGTAVGVGWEGSFGGSTFTL